MQKWPKTLPELTPEQKRIKDDFMKYWHEVLPKKYGVIEKFNHGYPVRQVKKGGMVLEIGSGLGEHIEYEDIDGIREYWALELRKEMADVIAQRFPSVKTVVGNCEERLNFPDNYFDRILAIHVLEHLPNLPAAIREAHRLLKPNGQFQVVIPCEGGLAYSLARQISAKRIFEKRYKTSYDWCIGSEHINVPSEIIEELEKHFTISHKSFFPLKVPFVFCNLVIGLVLEPKSTLSQ
jgi:ubiquinone/menaquinone biosynthesis C-methylase UbiE